MKAILLYIVPVVISSLYWWSVQDSSRRHLDDSVVMLVPIDCSIERTFVN